MEKTKIGVCFSVRTMIFHMNLKVIIKSFKGFFSDSEIDLKYLDTSYDIEMIWFDPVWQISLDRTRGLNTRENQVPV